MNEGEIIEKNVLDFTRIQKYMMMVDKDSDVYKEMRSHYIELKAILNSLGVNLTELDIIKE